MRDAARLDFVRFPPWGARALLVAIALPALFWRLGAPPIDRSMEGREALVVQEIVRSGDWILPRRNGEDVPHKPPLMHWAAAAIAWARGGIVDETTTRLPSAVASLVSLLLLFELVVAERGAVWAFTAALVLLTTECFSRAAREGWVDPVLAACVAGAMVAFRRMERRGRFGGPMSGGFAAALGLAILAKGPIGLAIPALGIGLYCASVRRGDALRALLRPAPLVLVAAVAVPWYAAALAQGGMLFVRTQVLEENLQRLVQGHEGSRPFWYFVPAFFGEAAPWGLLFPLAALAAWRRRGEPRLETFALAWFLGPFLFFSLAAGKRPVYLLPLMPAVAIVATGWVAALPSWRPWRLAPVAAGAVGTTAAAVLLWTAGATMGWWPGAAFLHGLGIDVRQRTLMPLAAALAASPAITLSSLVAVGASLGAVVLAAGRGSPRWTLAALVGLHLVYVSSLKPLRWEHYRRARALTGFASAVRDRVADGSLWYFRMKELSHLFFYLERHVPRAPCSRRDFATCPPGHYVLDGEQWARLPAEQRRGARLVLESRRFRAQPGGTNYVLVERSAPRSEDRVRPETSETQAT